MEEIQNKKVLLSQMDKLSSNNSILSENINDSIEMIASDTYVNTETEFYDTEDLPVFPFENVVRLV